MIRRATKKDFLRISEIIRNEYGKRPYNERWAITDAMGTLDNYVKTGVIFVSFMDKCVVGFIVIRKERYNEIVGLVIEELVVDSNFQGRGIGKSLIKFVELYGKKNKINRIILYANRNSLAYSIYKKQGFKDIKRMAYMQKDL